MCETENNIIEFLGGIDLTVGYSDGSTHSDGGIVATVEKSRVCHARRIMMHVSIINIAHGADHNKYEISRIVAELEDDSEVELARTVSKICDNVIDDQFCAACGKEIIDISQVEIYEGRAYHKHTCMR